MKEKVAVVVPAFNEEKTIASIIKGSKRYCDEVLLVSAKRCTDSTREIANSLGAKVLVDNGKGKGDGMRLAIRTIRSGIILFIDADGSHKPSDIPRILKPVKEGKADMVIGSRLLGGSMELHGTFNKFLRMFFSMCINQIINWRFNVNISDSQNGFRAIKQRLQKT